MTSCMLVKNGRNSARLPSQNGFALGRPLETWNDRPRDLEPIVREFKNEDVTEMASMRLDEMLRRKFCAIGLNGACSQRLPSHNNNESR
jgi:hypothetical protein